MTASALRIGRRCLTTVARVDTAPGVRQLATPLAFLSVQGFPTNSADFNWSSWAQYLAQDGYSSTLIHLERPKLVKSSQDLLARLEEELRKTLIEQNEAFPPVLFAQRSASLVAQTYVSSHPLSGLFLAWPTVPSKARLEAPDLFPTDLEEFTYEPNFPLMAQFARERDLVESRFSRLSETDDMGFLRTSVAKGEREALEQAKRWLEEEV